jgi:branched-chain amino acid transport system ATP-binding protein
MPSDRRPLLEVDRVSAGYGEMRVINDVSLEIYPSEIVALVGSNGAGKTTLLRALSRVLPCSGRIALNGVDLARKTPDEAFALGLVQVPEGRQLFDRMTVADNLLMGAYLRRDKAAVARALMASPVLLMVDEMSLGLAPVVVDQLMDALIAIRNEGLTIFLVEQDVNLALSAADRGYVLETGHVVQSGPARELIDDPKVQRAYLGQ